jgi:hypothetical protein
MAYLMTAYAKPAGHPVIAIRIFFRHIFCACIDNNCLPSIGYSGCQKNVPVFERFFLQPLMPRYLNSEQNFEKRYKIAFEDISHSDSKSAAEDDCYTRR